MTKVFLSQSLFEYRQEMAELVREVIKSQHIAGVQVWNSGEPPLAELDLLCPPKIEMIDLEIYEGKYMTSSCSRHRMILGLRTCM